MLRCQILIKKNSLQKMTAGFISLPRNRIHRKEETKCLNALPSNFVESFNKDSLGGIDFSLDTDSQQQLLSEMPSEDVKKFLLTTNALGKEIQGEIDLYVINSRLNEASFKRKLDPVSKKILKNQNPIDLLFKHIKYFDAQNRVIGSLIKEVDIGKKKNLSKFLYKVSDLRELEIRFRLNKLCEKNGFSENDNNNNNNKNNGENNFLPATPSPPHMDYENWNIFLPPAPSPFPFHLIG